MKLLQIILLALLTGCGTSIQNAVISSEFESPALEKSVQEWNNVAGYDLISWDGEADLQITVKKVDRTELEDASWQGEADFTDSTHCVIKIRKRDPGERYEWNLFAHEIGHCFGLNHSKDPNSIMYPKPIGWEFTEDDLAFLKVSPPQ